MTTRHIRESVVEDHLVNECARLGLLCYKVVSVGRRGLPDRLVLGHDSNGNPLSLFVELKRPGSTPRASQTARIQELRDHGTHVTVADSIGSVDAILRDYVLEPAMPMSQRNPLVAPSIGARPSIIVPKI